LVSICNYKAMACAISFYAGAAGALTGLLGFVSLERFGLFRCHEAVLAAGSDQSSAQCSGNSLWSTS
jgi:hypothetical protein